MTNGLPSKIGKLQIKASQFFHYFLIMGFHLDDCTLPDRLHTQVLPLTWMAFLGYAPAGSVGTFSYIGEMWTFKL